MTREPRDSSAACPTVRECRLRTKLATGGSLPAMRVCIVGASGKLGQYMVQHALDRSYQVVGVCREQSVGKLEGFKGRITVVPGATDDAEVIKKAVAECDALLVVLVPRGVHGYSTGTAQPRSIRPSGGPPRGSWLRRRPDFD